MPPVQSAYTEEHAQSLNGYLDSALRPREIYPGEFEFFTHEAAKCGGPVLELAAGAGRMLIVLVEAGFEVFGIEASWPMLEIGKRAIGQLPEEVRKRIHLIPGDMRRFAFTKKFPLIIIPWNSFWFNFNRDPLGEVFGQAEDCLGSLTEALEKGGTFIIDRPNSYSSLDTQWWETMAEKYRFTYDIVTPHKDYCGSSEVLIGRKRG